VATLYVLAAASMGVVALLFALLLFEPDLPYELSSPLPGLEVPQFPGLLASWVDAPLHADSQVTLLSGGERFYGAELEAIAGARHSIHLEAYIFRRSAIAERFIEALAERARQGVRVRLVLDAYGCLFTPEGCFARLREVGGDVRRYQPLDWGTLKRINNRTHRELLVVDGRVAFVGGAGVAGWWTDGTRGLPPWQDLVVRVEGPLAASVQACFMENWLESSGEILADPADFPSAGHAPGDSPPGAAVGFVVVSTPSAARSTRARILFQTLVSAARRSIAIQSPYFLPAPRMLEALTAARRRGVSVEIMVPGRHSNHPIARRASRRRYGALLGEGVAIHEYLPGMIHSKLLIVDRLWTVTGSTNFDNRSFRLNDEVNLVVRDAGLAAQAREQFEADLLSCEAVTLEAWHRRPGSERALAWLGTLIERQV